MFRRSGAARRATGGGPRTIGRVRAKDELGRRGERIAEQFLRDAGMAILDRNWRCPIGELDLVARDGGETVFVEVKTRSSQAFGHPFEALTDEKLARLRRLAYAWCGANGRRARIRVDAVSVLAPRGGVVVIEHLKAIA